MPNSSSITDEIGVEYIDDSGEGGLAAPFSRPHPPQRSGDYFMNVNRTIDVLMLPFLIPS